MATPQVQSLAQIMTDLDPGLAPSRDAIAKSQALLPQKYAAQKSALIAERGQGFNTINNQATGRGGSFSGIPIDEQATYLSTKFLPGMQAADTQMNEDSLALERESAGLYKDVYNNAFNTRNQQQGTLDNWNLEQARMEAQARENALDRSASAAARADDNREPTQEEYLRDAFEDSAYASMANGEDWLQNQSTEKSGVIGQLAQRYFSGDADAARAYVYNKRKAWYQS